MLYLKNPDYLVFVLGEVCVRIEHTLYCCNIAVMEYSES
jgi:hypothetical protein